MDEDGAELLPVLVTSRLRLRCWRSQDASALSTNLTSTVTRWLSSWPDPTSIDLAAERIAEARAGVSQGWHVSYAIERLSDGVVIGGFGGGAQDQRERVEIGYHLAEAAQGRGYMTEAAIAGLAAMWSLLPAQVIEAQVHPDNTASRTILTRLGMRFVEERPVYSTAREAWEPGCWYEIERPT
ncbi:GNAT family protein [Caulobacter sp. SSI4214]|uniref:GNAT family N-acetyltransferase n=1 Tax=Caulobacter sp. SSI4214 TaxID=2575739 RepID=UPI00143C46D4|nr:GNAT family protein [Caulobacter sp. SSI4214]